MNIEIDEARQLSKNLLLQWGFTVKEAGYCTDLLIEAELCGKPSHGLMRLIALKKMIDDGRVEVNNKEVEIVKETQISLLIDGKRKTGLYAVPQSLDMALEKFKREKLGLLAVGVNNTTPAAGMVGYYARKAAGRGLIYIGFHNSMSYLVPFGAKKSLWGTNPVTIGVPIKNGAVIWDCSAGKSSVGDIVLAKRKGKKIQKGIALNRDGEPTIDPAEALAGGILPFGEHKGSGMAMMVELLAGALIGSSITKSNQWNWGSFYILIDPKLLRPVKDFEESVRRSIDELKNSPKEKGKDRVYYPGEKSSLVRDDNLKRKSFVLDENTYNLLMNLSE